VIVSAAVESDASMQPLFPRPNFVAAWSSSFLIYFYPGKMARLLTRISLARAGAIAIINCVLALPWVMLVAASAYAWSQGVLRSPGYRGTVPYVHHPLRRFLSVFGTIWVGFSDIWTSLDFTEKTAAAAGLIAMAITIVAIAFFILLPFAARPGSGKACFRHVVRTLLLATGAIHIAAPILSSAFILFIAYRFGQSFFDIVSSLMLLLFGLGLWGFAALVKAAGADYRGPGEYPRPGDPTCEYCGYDLVAADPAGRCPECGHAVAESLGGGVRLTTPWEAHPSVFHFAGIARQLWLIVRRPRKLFQSMPTRDGQLAARRWLMMSFAMLATAGFFIVPTLYPCNIIPTWTPAIISGGLMMGLVWGLLGLMMVGIETGGVAMVSRMKGHPVPLAAAAKVTAYSAPLLLVWILLGGVQLVAFLYAWDHNYFRTYSIRTQQLIVAVSLAVAQIGGILWFEITVYRGIWAVRFANK
jgi:hypothetical protein